VCETSAQNDSNQLDCSGKMKHRTHLTICSPDYDAVGQILTVPHPTHFWSFRRGLYRRLDSMDCNASVLDKLMLERLPYRYSPMHNFCWISNSRSWVASISTDIFRAVPIW